MKKCIYLLVMLLQSFSLMAQDSINISDRPFRYIYIVHDHTSPVSTLIETLREAERDARQYNQVCIVHMASHIDNSEYKYFIAEINTEEDNREDFYKILEALNEKQSHEVNIDADIVSILELFNTYKIIDDEGNLLYKDVALDFFLTPYFCENGNAQRFIVPLYLAFDVPNIIGRFEFSVFVNGASENEALYSSEKIFGDKNYNSINENVLIMDY